MSVPYVWLPIIDNPVAGNTIDWLRVGYNVAGRNCWISARTDYKVKAAYYQGDNYYYIAAMCNAIYDGYFIYPLNEQRYSDGIYNLRPVNSNVFAGDVNRHAYKVEISQVLQSELNTDIPLYATSAEALAAMDDDNWDGPVSSYPITYRLTNATTTGPNEAAVGDTVTVPLTFPEGYGVVNPSSDVYVTCNGVLVPSTYSNGQLVFTMPDPS